MTNAKGTLIAYATDSGSTASDNPNESNGLFTKHFLTALDKPLNQRELFHNIRKGVNDESNGRQLPYLNDGTIGDFFFTVSDIIYQKSEVKFQNIAPSKFSLTINSTPSDAKVQITNIKPKYYDGIKLKKGIYNIKVSKEGYITKIGHIKLKGHVSLSITLEKEIIPIKRQKSNTQDIWRDNNTGLIWQVPIDSKQYTGEDAKQYCKNLSLGGYTNWRLPTLNELRSIKTANSYKNPYSSTDKVYIKKQLLKSMNMKDSRFLSSTVYYPPKTTYINFYYGFDSQGYLDGTYHIRCVR